MRSIATVQNIAQHPVHWHRRCCGPVLTAITILTIATGCQQPPDAPPIDIPPTSETEPNEEFATASVVNFDEQGRAFIQAEIAPFTTVINADFFALGSVQAGDRLRVEANAPDGMLDPVIAVLYPDGTLFAMNDDRDAQMDALDAIIDQVFPQSAEGIFLALAPAKRTVLLGGTYDILITLERGGPVPQPQFQTVLLDFDGGTATLRTGTVVTVGPFDAGDIDPRHAGQTPAVKAAIVETCLQNFARFGVEILNTDEHAPPTDRPFSTVLFGGSDPAGFGIAAEGIDLYNQNPSDTAVVFTQSFTPNRFSLPLEGFFLGVAIGNVASHEMGHLLGLQHVISIDDLMSPFDAPDLLLGDQRFRSSFLHPTLSLVFFYLPVSPPIFIQNGNLLLEQTLGRVSPATSFSLPTGESPNDITAADVNGDEAVDLIVANTFSNTVSVYLNDGAGMFSEPTDLQHHRRADRNSGRRSRQRQRPRSCRRQFGQLRCGDSAQQRRRPIHRLGVPPSRRGAHLHRVR